jgi:predicted NUDIX family NTP pyrophosphohydrolase
VAKVSAGLLLYRSRPAGPEVLLVHPGGPFFRNKDEGAWTIPKGEAGESESLLQVAVREFREETGVEAKGPFLPLEPIRQKGGKRVHAWAFEGDCDPRALRSNTFELEWPPRSGRKALFPEVDRADFFDLPAARIKINPAQVALLDSLSARLAEKVD